MKAEIRCSEFRGDNYSETGGEGSYSGVFKIGFEDDLETGDAVIFSLSIGGEVEKFNFSCEQSKEK